jgi:hypothetical protein
VKFGDLDLNTDAGRRELLDRLRKAARRVCAHEAAGHFFGDVYGSCYSSTLAAAVAKVHHEQVSALFAAMSRPARLPRLRLKRRQVWNLSIIRRRTMSRIGSLLAAICQLTSPIATSVSWDSAIVTRLPASTQRTV